MGYFDYPRLFFRASTPSAERAVSSPTTVPGSGTAKSGKSSPGLPGLSWLNGGNGGRHALAKPTTIMNIITPRTASKIFLFIFFTSTVHSGCLIKL